MADARGYAKWLVENQDKKGTPEFDTVSKAYQAAKIRAPLPAGADQSQPRLDRKTGAPKDVRALVGGTDRPQDRLATLRNFYADAQPYKDNNFVFTNPETGRPTLYNPPGLDLGDAVSLAREAAQTIGGTLGGLFGATAGPGGVATGVVTGTGVGEEAFNYGARQFGMEDTRTAGERGLETGIIALSSGGAGAAGAGAGRVGREGIRRAIRGTDAEGVNRAIDDAARWDGTPSVATATTPERINGIESMASKFPGGAGVFRRVVRRTGERISSQIRTKSTQIARRSDLDPDIAGKQILEGIDGFIVRSKNRSGELYDALDEFVDPQVAIPTSNTRTALGEIADKIDIPELNALLTSPTARGLQGAMPEEIPYEVLKQIRSVVGDKMTTKSLTDDISTRDLKRLYAGISEDMRAAIGPEGQQAFNRANKYHAARMNRIDNFLAPIARKNAPEEAFLALERGGKNGPTRIRALRSSLEPEQWNVVVGTVVRRLANVTDEAGDITGKDFSMQTFLTNWRKLDNSARDAMFSSPGLREYKRDLDALARWSARAEESSAAFANPSGTARAGAGLTLMGAGAAGPLLYPLMGSGALGVTATAVGLAATANMTSRLMTSPSFVRWLAQGTKIKPNGIGAHLGRLSEVAANSDQETAQAISEYLNILGESE